MIRKAIEDARKAAKPADKKKVNVVKQWMAPAT